jgi:hypothetical protein
MSMQLQSPEHRGCNKWTIVAGVVSTLILGPGLGVSAAQEAATTDVAFVETVRGRVIAFARGTPVLLSALDVIGDRTRIDLLADSELSVCHHRTQRFLTLKGPSRIMVSAQGVSNEAGKSVAPSTEPCAAATVSKHSGGLVTRGTQIKQ